MGKITLAALAAIVLVFGAETSRAQSSPGQQSGQQLQQQPSSHAQSSTTACSETPAGDRLRFVCPMPTFLPDEADADDDDSTDQAIRVVLKLPEGTALRVEIDQRTRISHVGEAVQGHVVQTVYAFDQPVVPAGTMVTGHVTKIVPVAKLRLLESYANGNFSPFRQYQVTFDRLLLAGRAGTCHRNLRRAGHRGSLSMSLASRNEIRMTTRLKHRKAVLPGRSAPPSRE